MRKIFIFVMLITSMALSTPNNNATAMDKLDLQNKQELIKTQKCNLLIAQNATADELRRSGCCSWHDGVCGCSNGRVQCCDGSLSPSCRC